MFFLVHGQSLRQVIGWFWLGILLLVIRQRISDLSTTNLKTETRKRLRVMASDIIWSMNSMEARAGIEPAFEALQASA